MCPGCCDSSSSVIIPGGVCSAACCHAPSIRTCRPGVVQLPDESSAGNCSISGNDDRTWKTSLWARYCPGLSLSLSFILLSHQLSQLLLWHIFCCRKRVCGGWSVIKSFTKGVRLFKSRDVWKKISLVSVFVNWVVHNFENKTIGLSQNLQLFSYLNTYFKATRFLWK